MLTVKSNLGKVTESLIGKLRSLSTTELQDKLTREIATTVLPNMRYRIHTEGKDSQDKAFGEYNNAYLKRRQQKPYNRTSDPTIVLSRTRQMENDFSVVKNRSRNGYGLGFKNSFNGQKALWLQQRYGRYYIPDPNELKLLRDTTEQFIKDLTNNALY